MIFWLEKVILYMISIYVEKGEKQMKSKVLNIGLVITLVIWLLTVTVSALSFTATMKASNTTVAESTEFTITVNVSNLDVGTNGINSLSGYLKYDSDIFETISKSSIEGLNNWAVKFDETTGKIELTKTDFVKSAEEVFQITFKTKSDVSGESGTISYANISASNSESEIKATDISTSITVGSAGSSGNTDNTGNVSNTNNIISIVSNNTVRNNTVKNNSVNNTNVSNNAVVNKSSNNAVNNVTNYTNTTVEQDMPYTGVNDTILALTFVVIGIAIAFYVKIEKLNKDIK